MTRTINLRNIIIDALLTGEEMCASTFAKARGFNQESVSRVLRDLVKHLDKRPAPKEPGKRRVYFKARDVAALLRIRNANRLGTNQYTNPGPVSTLRFDELLEVWGMRPVDLKLPSHPHIMYDEPEAAEA